MYVCLNKDISFELNKITMDVYYYLCVNHI